jgi:hypothetical protein
MEHLIVDPVTCEPLTARDANDTLNYDDTVGMSKDDISSSGLFGRLTVTLFSVLVSSSLLAAYSPSSFYLTIVYVAGSAIRPIFLFGSWKGWIYETTTPDAIIKLIEACYMKRHEEDLVGEEETYRMLQEIIRSPELFKAITGSSLKGATDPALDKLSEKDKAKLEHLNKLEQKNFDVTALQDKITGKGTKAAGEDIDLD